MPCALGRPQMDLLIQSLVISNDSWSPNETESVKDHVYAYSLPDHTRSWPAAWVALDILNYYYIPGMVIVGLFGNAISCIVFLCTHLHVRSSSYYLAALAIADLAYLLTLFLVWLTSVGVELFNQNGWCQLVVYLSSVSSFLSVWFIIGFTVERFIAVQYPLQRPHMCTVKRAKIIVCSLSAFGFSIHIYLVFMAGIVLIDGDEGSPSISICGLLPSFYAAMSVLNTVDTVLTLILPSALIVVMNMLIARQLYIFSQKHRTPVAAEPQPQPASTVVSNVRATSRHSVERNSNDPSSGSRSGGSSANRSQNNNNLRMNDVERAAHDLNADRNFKPSCHRSILSQRTQYTITKMLLLISTVFLILNLPSYVSRIYLFIGDHGSSPNPERSEAAFLIQQFSMLLYYSNFSINFLLYSMYGVTFRRALMYLARNHLRLTKIWKTRSDSLQFK